jgi:hypothetical protein
VLLLLGVPELDGQLHRSLLYRLPKIFQKPDRLPVKIIEAWAETHFPLLNEFDRTVLIAPIRKHPGNNFI